MKLKPDCMRSILLFIEDLPINSEATIKDFINNLCDFSEDDISYTIYTLHEAGFINGTLVKSKTTTIPYVYSVTSLTYEGHQLLEDIRSEKVWNPVKTVINDIGSSSINTISQVASSVISQLIANALKIN